MGNGGGYPTISYQDELKVVMVAIATYEKLAPLGKVEFRVSALSHGTPEHSESARPTSNHCNEAEGLGKASDKLIGPRRSVREIKKGHRLA